MSFLPVPGEAQIHQALRTVLLAILPAGVSVVLGQVNQVAEPKGDFVVFTPLRQERISTNIDTYSDCRLIGSVTGTTLTATSISFGALVAGRTLYGTGAAVAPTITAVTSPTTATISTALTVPSTVLASGTKLITNKTKHVFQLDVHSPDMARASDNAQTIATVWRDDTGVQLFKSTGFPVSPLYADDRKQVPFSNAEGQVENRYVIDCHVQVDQVLTPPQDFADSVQFTRLPADIFYRA